ncbi:MAG: hypothetical protein AAF394_03860 [Planctomycetota bacterium]
MTSSTTEDGKPELVRSGNSYLNPGPPGMNPQAFLRLTTQVFLLAIPICVAHCSPTAIAQDREQKLAEFLERYPESDLNHDGELTREEVRQFNEKRRSKPERSRKRERPKPTAGFAYGEHEKQCFDIWSVPDAKAPTPLVIFIHGGGFRGGDKGCFQPKHH